MVSDNAGTDVTTLLIYYGFDLCGKTPNALVESWMREFPVSWVRLATIEALYQGRYKTISVEQILIFWQRRGQPICHFNREFEAIVCHQLPERGNLSDNSKIEVPLKPRTSSSLLPQTGNVRGDQIRGDQVRGGDRLQLPKHRKLTNLEIETSDNTSIQQTTTSSEVEDEQKGKEGEGENEESSGDRLLPPSSTNASKQPIDKFIPNSQDSQFYKKLKAVVDSKTNTFE